jgi:hypothetical protein
MGKDRLGSQYLLKMGDCVSQVMNNRQEMIHEAHEQDQEMARSIDTAIFGLFSHYPLVNKSGFPNCANN